MTVGEVAASFPPSGSIQELFICSPPTGGVSPTARFYFPKRAAPMPQALPLEMPTGDAGCFREALICLNHS